MAVTKMTAMWKIDRIIYVCSRLCIFMTKHTHFKNGQIENTVRSIKKVHDSHLFAGIVILRWKYPTFAHSSVSSFFWLYTL